MKKIEKVRERRQIIKRETLPLFPPLLLLFSNICRQGAEDVIRNAETQKNIWIIAEN